MALLRAAKRVVFPAVILAVSVCACLVLAELGLAWHEYPPIPVSGRTSEQNYPSRGAELNQLRYRGQRIAYSDDGLVVVLLGDSQAEAVSCAFEAMPEKRLQPHLASLTQYFDNIRYVNKDLEFVYIPIERSGWAVSPTDPHLNASAVDDVMKYVADRLSSHLP